VFQLVPTGTALHVQDFAGVKERVDHVSIARVYVRI
jgi:hypothetical protein